MESSLQKVNDISIQVEVTPKVNYALARWLNDTNRSSGGQLIRLLQICNEGAAIDNSQIKVWAEPQFISPRAWHLDHIAEKSTFTLDNTAIDLNVGFLAELSEGISGTIHFEWSADGHETATQSYSVELAAPTHWMGIVDEHDPHRELIAAHVLPNDSAVSKILKTASEILKRSGKRSAIEGYQSNDGQRVVEIMAAIWQAVQSQELTYAEPPASFEKIGQKIRTPSQILRDGLATCLDTATLFAACFEQAGIHPIIVFIPGHAFVGGWIKDQCFDQVNTRDASALRKGCSLNELLFFETTLVPDPDVSFQDAFQTRDIPERIEAIDVAKARQYGVKPIPLTEESKVILAPKSTFPKQHKLRDTSWMEQFAASSDENSATENKQEKEDRLEEWQRNLLDLSTRNALLNLNMDSKKVVPFTSFDPHILEEILAAGKRLQIVSPPAELIQRGDDAGNLQRIRGYAASVLNDKDRKLMTVLSENDLDRRLIGLMRDGARDLREGGANTLFLALGFLRWSEPQSRLDRDYFAPLILLPVTLERTSARSKIYLAALDEEPRFNATLLQKLLQDFNLSIPELEKGLPQTEDSAGNSIVDAAQVFRLINSAVRDYQGWELATGAALATFSFARYLMWRDLREQGDLIKKNALVRHLIENPLQKYSSGGDFPQVQELDQRYSPSNIFMPLPADSSQMAAALAAAEGKDFVLIGPPGTGKSQSIVNMISHCLAEGKKVLFVSAKKAALDVVYRRMREVGLDDFCLSLHSRKGSNKGAYEQLKRAATRWDADPKDDEWRRATGQLLRQRKQLNRYVAHLHREYPNGLTPYRVMGNLLRAPDLPKIQFPWTDPAQHSREALQSMRAAAQNLSIAFPTSMSATQRALFKSVLVTNWSPSIEEHFATTVSTCAQQLRGFSGQRDSFTKVLLSAPLSENIASSSPVCNALLKLAHFIINRPQQATKVLFIANTQEIKGRITAATKLLTDYRGIWQSLSCPYHEDAAISLNIQQLENDWRAAAGKIWPFRIFAQNAVTRILQTATVDGQKPNPAADITRLRRWKELKQQLEAIQFSEKSTFGLWQGTKTNAEELQNTVDAAIEMGEKIDAVVKTCSSDEDVRDALRESVAELLQSTERTAIDEAAQQFLAAYQRLSPALNELKSTIGTPVTELVDTNQNGWLTDLADTCGNWQQNSSYLRTWANWQRERKNAVDLDLAPLVEAIENGDVSVDQARQSFEISYKQRWLRNVMDQDSVLNRFNGREQESTVNAFVRGVDHYLQLTRDYARTCIIRKQQALQGDEQDRQMGLLTRELKKKARFKPFRQMMAAASPAILSLTPCMMMSPLSVAQYLDLGEQLFDVVIFDEASQIPVWDAIGALARGKQSIVVGDPKQMPPTNFFGRSSENNEEDVDSISSAESILDECISSRVSTLQLDWHYRSRYEDLIAFSNYHYYGGRLITFPAPTTKDNSVSFHYVENGVYATGQARHNQNEAKAVVADIVKHLKSPAPNGKKLSVGVVTFNMQQQRLIEDLLDAERRKDPSLEKYFYEDDLEPVMVRNLESVQGDERDIMYFSITFGPSPKGRISMNFGPLNKDGGERRLNVAITRARHKMKVFSSLRPEQIDLNRTGAIGTRHLKHFLEFAERGTASFAQQADVTGHSFDSDFEEAVSDALTKRGWRVYPQIGVANFRIDLGVVHPDFPGKYLAGIECDGATYHSAATARDRDKVREGVLRGLGWEILRIWSTDWWADPETIADQVHAELKDLHQKSLLPLDEPQVPESAEADEKSTFIDETAEPQNTELSQSTLFKNSSTKSEPVEAKLGDSLEITKYQIARFEEAGMQPSPNLFYEEEYDEKLFGLISAIIQQEAPIFEEVLIRRITRAHSFARTGQRIRSRIKKIIAHQFPTSEENGEKIYWASSEARSHWNEFREATSKGDVRTLEEIPLIELRVLGKIVQQTETNPEVILSKMAIYCGLKRLGDKSRIRLENALEFCA